MADVLHHETFLLVRMIYSHVCSTLVVSGWARCSSPLIICPLASQYHVMLDASIYPTHCNFAQLGPVAVRSTHLLNIRLMMCQSY